MFVLTPHPSHPSFCVPTCITWYMILRRILISILIYCTLYYQKKSVSACKARLLERSPDGALRVRRGNALPVRRSKMTQRAVKRARSAMTQRAMTQRALKGAPALTCAPRPASGSRSAALTHSCIHRHVLVVVALLCFYST